jgi:hypothetical protein
VCPPQDLLLPLLVLLLLLVLVLLRHALPAALPLLQHLQVTGCRCHRPPLLLLLRVERALPVVPWSAPQPGQQHVCGTCR